MNEIYEFGGQLRELMRGLLDGPGPIILTTVPLKKTLDECKRVNIGTSDGSKICIKLLSADFSHESNTVTVGDGNGDKYTWNDKNLGDFWNGAAAGDIWLHYRKNRGGGDRVTVEYEVT